MEVLTIEHRAFQQLISKIDVMDEFIRKAKFEQQSSLDDDWVDGELIRNSFATNRRKRA